MPPTPHELVNSASEASGGLKRMHIDTNAPFKTWTTLDRSLANLRGVSTMWNASTSIFLSSCGSPLVIKLLLLLLSPLIFDSIEAGWGRGGNNITSLIKSSIIILFYVPEGVKKSPYMTRSMLTALIGWWLENTSVTETPYWQKDKATNASNFIFQSRISSLVHMLDYIPCLQAILLLRNQYAATKDSPVRYDGHI